jgi:micrococcal nuclease
MARLAALLVPPRPARRSRHEHHASRRRRRERLEWCGRTLVVGLMGAAAFIAGILWERVAAAEPPIDRESALFARCGAAARVTCVVDGDTLWYRGAKIRLADINTPELSRPACPREAALGEAATRRLAELLSQGPFTLARWSADPARDRDRYGRLLRTVTRGGESLGAALVREGLAETWQGRRGSWC